TAPQPERDVIDDLAEAQESRLRAIHEALYHEAGGTPLSAEAVSMLSYLGDRKAIKQARGAASTGHDAVQEFKRTASAESRAADARAKLAKEAPGLRKRIEDLQR